ncbi:MAG: 4Fe-4S binding protein [Chloroherpetonaceae bacterium]|nr:4Fe-4S binding protein [Chloroherpetonaceae bacterium]
MRSVTSEAESKSVRRQRQAVQAIFVFINLVLIDTRLPSLTWAVIGGVFWTAIIVITITNGPIVCSWVCWLGAAQDWAEPLAKRRWKLSPSFWRGFMLAVAVLWAPFSWLIRPELLNSIAIPFGFDYTDLQAHFLQAGFFLVVGLSVAVLGKRGACLHFCPLLMVSRMMRMKNFFSSLRIRQLFGKPIVLNAVVPKADS